MKTHLYTPRLFQRVFAAFLTLLVAASAYTQDLRKLADFDYAVTGKYTNYPGGFTQGSDGNFYGTTSEGGPIGLGTAFKLTPTGTLTVLAEFNNLEDVGYYPIGPIVEGQDGYFYGLTYAGGAHGVGVVFKFNAAGAVVRVADFPSDLGFADSGLIRGTDGNFYGTTSSGGAHNVGVAFKVSADGSIEKLADFSHPVGAYPKGGLFQATDGNFYGTATGGGDVGVGTIFQLTPSGTLTKIAEFDPNTGGNPEGGVVPDSFGNFYGVTPNYGAHSAGTIFKLPPGGVITKVADFDAATTGFGPRSRLLLASDGNFYGVTSSGGPSGGGTIFRTTPEGEINVLRVFDYDVYGASSSTGLIQGADGDFYGVNTEGGAKNAGVAFSYLSDVVPPGAPQVKVRTLPDDIAIPSGSGSVSFGTVGYGRIASKGFRLQNVGESEIVLTPSVFGPHAEGFSVRLQGTLPDMPLTLAPGQATIFSVTFTPGEAPSTPVPQHEATLQFDIEGSATPFTFQVAGKALIGAPVFRIEEPVGKVRTLNSSTAVDFGSVSLPEETTKTFTIRNTGIVDLHVSFAEVNGTHSLDFYVEGAASTVPAGGTRQFTVVFHPLGGGLRTARIDFEHDAPSAMNYLSLKGTGIAPVPGIAVSHDDKSVADGGTVAFGTTSIDGAERELVITNTGSGDLELGTISFLGTGAADYHYYLAGDSFVPPGESTTVVVVFMPSKTGSRAATLRIESNVTGSKSPYDIKLTGSLDAVKPTVTLTVSPDGAGAYNISGTVKENIGLQDFFVTRNGEPLTLDEPYPDFNSTTAQSWSVTGVGLENGPNTIVATAQDSSGNITTVTRTVNFVNPALSGLAGIYQAVLTPAGEASVDNTGMISVTVAATGAFSGKVSLGGVVVPCSGFLRNDGTARFKPLLGTTLPLIDRTEYLSSFGLLSFAVTAAAGLDGRIVETGAPDAAIVSTFTGRKALTSVEVALAGVYNVAFPAQPQVVEGNPTPRGAGFSRISITTKGAVSVSGQLADGTKLTGSTKLRADGSAPIFVALYRKQGSFAGDVSLVNDTDRDIAGDDLLWVRPANRRALYYPLGWPSGALVDATGAKYSAAVYDIGQPAVAAPAVNALLTVSNGLLVSDVQQYVNLSPAGKLTGGGVIAISLNAGTGLLTGTTKYPTLHGPGTTDLRGIMVSKGGIGKGYGYSLSPALHPVTGHPYAAPGEGGNMVLEAIVP